MSASSAARLAGVSRFVSARDGLRLHARDYETDAATGLPVVCLPGLSRTADDFDALAAALASGAYAPARRVLALDYRGRGQSAWDPDPRRYDLRVESDDIASVLTALGVSRAVFVGTSRGGLHIMMLAALRPTFLAAAVLNDIGPVIASQGLARIKSYIGKMPQLGSWADAVAALRRIADSRFTGLSEEDWQAYARLTFEERDGIIGSRYDPALMVNLEAMDLAAIPELWDQFDGLAHLPLMVIRGENSDLLEATTAAAMVERHPGCELVEVPGQGHAPLLLDETTISQIARFIARCE